MEHITEDDIWTNRHSKTFLTEKEAIYMFTKIREWCDQTGRYYAKSDIRPCFNSVTKDSIPTNSSNHWDSHGFCSQIYIQKRHGPMYTMGIQTGEPKTFELHVNSHWGHLPEMLVELEMINKFMDEYIA